MTTILIGETMLIQKKLMMTYEGEIVVVAINPYIMTEEYFNLIQLLYKDICKIIFHVEKRRQYLVFYFPSYSPCTIVNRRDVVEHLEKLMNDHQLYLPLDQEYKIEHFVLIDKKQVVYTNIGNMVSITDMPIPQTIPIHLISNKRILKAIEKCDAQVLKKVFKKSVYTFLKNLFVLANTSDFQCQFDCSILSPMEVDHKICYQLKLNTYISCSFNL